MNPANIVSLSPTTRFTQPFLNMVADKSLMNSSVCLITIPPIKCELSQLAFNTTLTGKLLSVN